MNNSVNNSLVLILILLLIVVSMSTMLKGREKKDLETIELRADDVIKDIEKKGYLTDISEYEKVLW